MIQKHLVHPALTGRDLDEDLSLIAFIEVNTFNASSALSFRHLMNEAEDMCERTGQGRIPIVIDSFGGDPYSLLAMIDRIEQSNVPVDTVVTGKAMSCGSILLSCGVNRYATPSATIMVHGGSAEFEGSIDNIRMQANHLDSLDDMCYEILDKNTGNLPGYWKQLVSSQTGNTDLYLTPQQALSRGMVTHIGAPVVKAVIDLKVYYAV